MREVIGYFLISTPIILLFIAIWRAYSLKMAAYVFMAAIGLNAMVMLGGSLIKP